MLLSRVQVFIIQGHYEGHIEPTRVHQAYWHGKQVLSWLRQEYSSLFRKAAEDISLRCEIENILSNHRISFKEVAFGMKDVSCDKNRVPIFYVLVNGITSYVPRLTWFASE